MTRVRAIAEIVLNVRDIGAMERFYADVLGFEPYASIPETAPTIVFMQIAPLPAPLGTTHPQSLVLIDPARHVAAQGKYGTPDWHRSTLNHLAFQIETDDFDAEFGRLGSLGLSPQVVEFGWIRAKAIFFRDPEGNTLELICHDPDA